MCVLHGNMDHFFNLILALIASPRKSRLMERVGHYRIVIKRVTVDLLLLHYNKWTSFVILTHLEIELP